MAEKITYEGLLAEGKTMDELLQTEAGILELIEVFQNSFSTLFIYLQPNDLINQMVLDGKILMGIRGGLKCYALITEGNTDGINSK